MVLKALEIQGFKSFPDKIRINFERGVTGVVGPNGSGKSNISDAIRWVLGETSARQLRGGGKMENVIFSGTGGDARRGAMGYASVRLVLDNTDRLVDVDADEVTIGRKYYRSGESEYSINGQAVRLRDVYELFLDTGLGRDGYSIIGQGRIAEIVSSKSDERREIFEEASGIARYRYRKNEAERRLAASEDNLVRLRDILGELESRVGPLERESQKAQRFLEYAAQRKSLEVTLWMDDIRRARDAVRTEQRRREIAQNDYDADTARMTQLDAEAETLQAERERLDIRIEDAGRAVQAMTEEAAGVETQIAVLHTEIRHNDETIEALRAEMAAAAAGEEDIVAGVQAAEAAIAERETAIAGYEADIAAVRGQLEELTRQSAASDSRRAALSAALSAAGERATELKVTRAAAASAAEAAKDRLAAATAEGAEAQKAVETLTAEAADTRALDAHLAEEATRLGNIREGLTYKLDTRTAGLQKAQDAVAALERDTQTTVQRLKVLQELERSMEGYQNSVKTVIRAAEAHRLRGIVGTVGSLLQVEPGYEIAIETALGAALQNVVTLDEAAAKAAIAYLKEEKAGRVTLLPLDTVQPQRLHADAKLEDALPAAEVVRTDAKYDVVVQNLLGRIVIAEDINRAAALARKNGYRFRIVTLDGQVVNAGGSFTGGSVGRTAGVFSRRQEIEELGARLLKLDKKLKEAQATARRYKEETDALTAEATATDSEIITVNGDRIRSGMELERLENALAAQKNAAAALAGECESLQVRLAEAGAKAADAEKELAACDARTAQLQAQLAALDGDGSFAALHTAASEKLAALQMDRMGAEKDIALHRQTIETLQSRRGESREADAARTANIGRLQAENDARRRDIAAVEAARSEVAARIDQKRAEASEARAARMEREGRINALNAQQRQLADHREEMGREIARLSEREQTLSNEYETTVARLWEEYELTLTDAASLSVEFDSVTELRRQVAEVRGKIRALGNVNVSAIDEYAEVSARYTEMKEQVDDVERAKAELGRLIAQISGEMKELFSASFAQINNHFGHIFAELFGGGTASLTLTDPDDILDSGIDIAVSPPGKLIKNLSSLSGGEQALVAVSIYFAILAVNPSPFCVLDEIEAALDEVNVGRYAQYLHRISDKTQFIVITHRRGTMESADMLYGVTMQEDGVSKVLRLDPANVDVSLIGDK